MAVGAVQAAVAGRARTRALGSGAAIGALRHAGPRQADARHPPPLDALGLWLEQLIAESTGKEGKGIVPMAGEPLGRPSVYGDDRALRAVRWPATTDGATSRAARCPRRRRPPGASTCVLDDPLDLGAEFFRWEFATAVAGALLGINPFDQPNVQESKDNTKSLLEELQGEGGR